MRKVFGKYVHLTEPLTNNPSGQDCLLLCRMAQLHTNYHTSVQLHSISGIVNLAAHVNICITGNPPNAAKITSQSFCDILYSIRLPNNSPLFLSILPRPSRMMVDCVIPNTAAAEMCLVQMNQHLLGYLKFYLKELGYNNDGVVNILNCACDTDLTATISQLSWDAKHKVIILPSEAKLEFDFDEVETAPWMQSALLSSPFPPSCKHYNDPDHAFLLNSDLLVTTIHANKQSSEHPSSPTSATTSSTSSHKKEVVIIKPQAQDDVSTLSTMSKGDLVKLL